ncbi:MAG TPA: hypothetical protein VGC69_14005 [Bordetella sp.]
MTVRDHLNTFFYYRKIAAMVFLAIAVLGIASALILPMPYQAQARLLVLFAGYYDQSNATRGVPVVPAIGELVSVEAQILESPELHRAVVLSELGPNPTQQAIDQRLHDFENRLHLEQTDLANTINLSYTDNDPKRAANALSRLLTEYFRQRATIFISGRASLLAEQQGEVRKKLDQANAALLAFQQAHGIVSINDQISRAVALENLLTQRKMENDAALVQDRGGLEALQAATRDVQPDITLFTDNSEIAHTLATMQVSLMQLETQRSELASRYMGSSPFVQQLDKQIADMRSNIGKQKQQLLSATRYGHNSYYDTVQDRLAGMLTNISGEVARQKELQNQVAEAHARSQNLIALADQLRQMQADRDLLADSFRERARQVEQADIQQEQASKVNSTNVRVIQAPLPPTRHSVSRGLLIAASLVAALVVSALVVLVAATLRETFLSPEQVERALSLPILSAPIIVRRAAARLGSTPATASPATAPEVASPFSGAPPAAAAAAKPVRGGLSARIAHMAYGRMASAIYGSSNAASKLVMMLAPGKDEGVHKVIQGMAVEQERRSVHPVLILDMDVAPEASLYGLVNAQGLIDWPDVEPVNPVSGAGTYARIPGMDFHRVAGHNIVVARPDAGLLSSSRQQAASLFGALRQYYEYILVHAPPANRSFAGIENVTLVDAVVLVIRAEATRKPVAQSLKEQVLDAGGKIIGVAMTYRRQYIPEPIYRIFF